MTYEEIKEDYLNHKNPFPNKLGVVITEIQEGYATAGAGAGLYQTNGASSVHGGMLFTLCDTTCGAAAASYQYKTTTVDTSFITCGRRCTAASCGRWQRKSARKADYGIRFGSI